MRKIKIMPLGDSITDGFTTPGGYRTTLCRLIEENGLRDNIVFAGSQSSGDCYDPRHEGHPAWATVDIDPAKGDERGEAREGITKHLDEWLSAAKPDVVLLQIGTNDILSNYRLDELPARLEAIVDKVLSYLPEDGKLYLATIPTMDGSIHHFVPDFYDEESLDKAVNAYNTAIRRIAASKPRTILAEINGVLSKNELADGVHPTAGGYRRLGEYWYSVLF